MNELTLPIAALSAFCLAVGCERNDRNDRAEDRPDVKDALERDGPIDGAITPEARRIAERDPAVDPNHSALDTPKDDHRVQFVATARRRLQEIDREMAQLDTRARERGKELRTDLREEKRRLEADLEHLETESEEAWVRTKDGFHDALERLEGEIRKVRQEIDPDPEA